MHHLGSTAVCLFPWTNSHLESRKFSYSVFTKLGSEEITSSRVQQLTAAFWMVFRNEEQWAWILQDPSRISICLEGLKELHIANIKNCTLFLLALLVCDVFLIFIAPSLIRCGNSTMEIIALGPFDSAHHKKIPLLLKILLWYPTSGSDRTFTVLSFENIVIPGLLVAYPHRSNIQVYSSWINFVTSIAASSCGVGKLCCFSISTERSASSFLLCAIHSYCLPGCCFFAPEAESFMDRQWFYTSGLLFSEVSIK